MNFFGAGRKIALFALLSLPAMCTHPDRQIADGRHGDRAAARLGQPRHPTVERAAVEDRPDMPSPCSQRAYRSKHPWPEWPRR
jgi:hypothetical protein